MKFDPQKHQRTSTRMKGYDYSLAGAYFITLVTYQRDMLFGEIKNGVMKLNRHGQIVHEEWFRSAQIRKEIRLYEEDFVVMPNHMHGIVWIVDDNNNDDVEVDGIRPIEINHDSVGATGRSPLRNGPKPKSVSSFVAGFKSSLPPPPSAPPPNTI